MKSNSWGRYFGITTFGESHGKAMGLVLEDITPGIDFPYDKLKTALKKRKPGQSEFSSSRNEPDNFEILSGVWKGKTTGMPICIIFPNRDARSSDYEIIKNTFRPGHADFTFFKKFKIYDYRGGSRASGRETISRVAAGELVSFLLKDIKIELYAIQIGKIRAKNINLPVQNKLHWPDDNLQQLEHYLKEIKTQKNSVGGIIEAKIVNAPIGLGDPVFEKLDANLSKAILSLGAVKGIEFGDGFNLASLKGSEANDQIDKNDFLSNHCGGIQGGISNGNDIVFRFVVKPTPSIQIPQKTITHNNEPVKIKLRGRYDICIVPRIIPAAEAMIKLVLADALAFQKLISNKNKTLPELREAIDKIDEDILLALARRNKISQAIGNRKRQKNIGVTDKEREIQLLKNILEKAATLNLSKTTVEKIWQAIIKESKLQQ
ncbi:MAG: chorismate synthase [Candidatus Cloacimonadota bacterium]|nr:chorismate synthase [Candidatus Cloacimonadota bacterium]